MTGEAIMLSPTFVRRVTAPGHYGDGRGGLGLSLLVKPTAEEGRLSQTWSQSVTVNGRSTMIGLGSYAIVTLPPSREGPREPAGDREGPHPAPTFAVAAEHAIDARRDGWHPATEAHWRSSLRRYVWDYASVSRRGADAMGLCDGRPFGRLLWGRWAVDATRTPAGALTDPDPDYILGCCEACDRWTAVARCDTED